ncbi:oligosaccharide flippase family protein [Blastomonas sp.]|uniref:oligosaccharide flippase family protein n=1 Tax=Blastomonas sp. TaxID=1909299 RepID=UPI003593C099
MVLTRLLAPEIFGIMLLINSLRTGTELLSDIGIGQSVVRSPNGEDRNFLDVAWTLQVLRGVLLTAFALLAAAPIAALYGQPDLMPLILAMSPMFIFTGLQSAGLFVSQRRMQLQRRAIYDITSTVVGSALAIGLALVIKSAWALVIALVVGTIISTILSFVIFERRLPRFRWEAAHVREIISFGKWIFFSTAIYFAATSYDRLYFVAAVPIAMAGIYGVARTFSDMLTGLAQRAGAFLVFPRAAAAHNQDGAFADRLRGTRRKTLALLALVTGVAVAGSDQFILLAYDPRYNAAAFMIPVLMVGVWFAILSTFADAMLMGAGRPAPGAWANLAKFAVMLVGLPFALARGSLLDALLVLVLAEAVRWLALLPASRRERFGGVRDDCLLTALMAITALTAKWLFGTAGLAPTLGEWWAMRALLQL